MNTNPAQINDLRLALTALTGRDHDFAASLCEQWNRKGSLSDKQWPYVAQLVAKANAPKPAPVVEQVGDFAGLIALFEKAKDSGIQHPKIRIDVDGEIVVLAMAGANSGYCGQINVQTPGSFETRTWFGRVNEQGEFTRSKRDAPAGLVSTLALLASNPALAGAAHGRKTGNCCFCARQLTDGRSIEVGYGPICADKWGLPWGEA